MGCIEETLILIYHRRSRRNHNLVIAPLLKIFGFSHKIWFHHWDLSSKLKSFNIMQSSVFLAKIFHLIFHIYHKYATYFLFYECAYLRFFNACENLLTYGRNMNEPQPHNTINRIFQK